MLTLRTVGAGSGHRYLTSQVATGREDFCEVTSDKASDYFAAGTARGESQGRWIGRGLDGLGVAGEVRTEQLDQVLGTGSHPDADRLYRQGLSELATRYGSTDAIPASAMRKLDASVQLGRKFATYDSAEKRIADALAELPEDATEADRELIRRTELAKGDKQAVAAYELTFQPAKSVSVLWASTSGQEQSAVWQAHVDAVAEAINYLEKHAAFTRAGAGGVQQIDSDGLIVAAFEHRMSRDKDPSIHTHALVINRVQGVDGKWRALDGSALYQASVGARALYETALERNLATTMGVAMAPREGSVIREVVGVPATVVDMFSKRRTSILAGAEDARPGGVRMGQRAWKRLAQRVTLATRAPKGGPETTEEAARRWRRELTEAGVDVRQMLTDVRRGPVPGQNVDRDLATVAGTALDLVGEQRTVWSAHHLRLALYRVAPVQPGDTAASYEAFIDAAQRHALASSAAEAVSPEPVISGRGTDRRSSDGASVYHRHGATRFALTTSREAERRLLNALTLTSENRVDDAVTEQTVTANGLDSEQATAVRAAVSSDRQVNLLIGPAGTGKTFTQRSVAQAWSANGGTVIALAPSQIGARVLGEEIGCRGENLTKWLYERSRRRVDPQWEINSSTLLIVDEAGMASTRELDSAVAQAVQAGARVLLVGDDQQLQAVGAGGMFRTLAREGNATMLTTVRRFRESDGQIRQWEADASLMLRDHNPDALDLYEQHGRIHGGAEQDMVRAAYSGWLAAALDRWEDPNAAILVTDTEEQASELSTAARAELVSRGLVEAAGVTLRDGTTAGTGDRVVTRMNARALGGEDGEFVANRDTWTVVRAEDNGALVVRRNGDQDQADVVLPPEYVAQHVQLAYAGTIHSAQGRTVRQSFAIQSESSSAAGLYVALTRGTISNQVFVPTTDADAERYHLGPNRHAVSVLGGVLRAEREEQFSISDYVAHAREEQHQLASLRPLWTDLNEREAARRWQGALTEACAGRPDLDGVAERIAGGAAWPALARQLDELHAEGWPVEDILRQAVPARDFGDADDPAAVMHWRVNRVVEGRGVPAPVPGDSTRRPWVQQIPAAAGDALLEVATAMDAREHELADSAVADPEPWRRLLGRLPEQVDRLAVWRDQARRIAAYQDLAGYNPGDSKDPIGPRPRSAELGAVWADARRAVIEARNAPTLRVMSDGGLRRIIDRARAVEAQAPVNPALELRVVTIERRITAAALDDARAVETIARARLESTSARVLRRPGIVRGLRAAVEPAAAAVAVAEGRHQEVVGRYTALTEAADRWREWETATAEQRHMSRLAVQELQVRSSTTAAPGSRVTAPKLPADRTATAELDDVLSTLTSSGDDRGERARQAAREADRAAADREMER